MITTRQLWSGVKWPQTNKATPTYQLGDWLFLVEGEQSDGGVCAPGGHQGLLALLVGGHHANGGHEVAMARETHV